MAGDANKKHTASFQQGLDAKWSLKDITGKATTKLYIYKAKNIFGDPDTENIFTIENSIVYKRLELVQEVDALRTTEQVTSNLEPLQKNKVINRQADSPINAKSYVIHAGVDFEDANIFITEKPFVENSVVNRKDIYKMMSLQKSTVGRILAGNITEKTNKLRNNAVEVISMQPAVLFNNLDDSELHFISSANVIPYDKPDFKITSIDVNTDHSFLPEFNNWFKAYGKLDNLKTESGYDLDFKMNEPLMPILIGIYGIQDKLQFFVQTLNKNIVMPWYYAQRFVATTTIEEYIKGDLTDVIYKDNDHLYARDLSTALLDMFKLSHAFSTGFSEYREAATGIIKDEKIGGVSLKALEAKDAQTAITQIIKNWEYKYPAKKTTDEYIRAIQFLAACGEWVKCDYCIDGGLNNLHKTILPYYLDLTTEISKTSEITKLNFKLNSLRFDFDAAIPLAHPVIKHKEKNKEASRILIDETDRFTSLPEIGNPLTTTGISTFAKDIKGSNQNTLKYFVGADITSSGKLGEFLINAKAKGSITKNISYTYTTLWHPKLVPNSFDKDIEFIGLAGGQTVRGVEVDTDVFIDSDNFLIDNVELPVGSYDKSIIDNGQEELLVASLQWIIRRKSNGRTFTTGFSTEIIKKKNVVIEFKIQQEINSVEEHEYAFDLGTWKETAIYYSENNSENWNRTLTLKDIYQNKNLKSIRNIDISGIGGSFMQFIIHYEYTAPDGSKVKEGFITPKYKSNVDESITKKSFWF